MILSNGSRQVIGGVTYRFVIVAPSMIVLQVQILAVHFDHQHVGLGKTLVYFLHNAIANKLAARSDKSTCACSGCIHVQADNGAVGFWSKMGFAANHLAEDLCSALHTWHPDQYPVYHGASAMIAKVLSSREIPAFAAASFSPLDTCSATTRTRDHVRRKKQPVSRFIAGPAEPPRVLHKRRRERSVTHAEVTVPTIAVDASSASPPEDAEPAEVAATALILAIGSTGQVQSPADGAIQKAKRGLRDALRAKVRELQNGIDVLQAEVSVDVVPSTVVSPADPDIQKARSALQEARLSKIREMREAMAQHEAEVMRLA